MVIEFIPLDDLRLYNFFVYLIRLKLSQSFTSIKSCVYTSY